MNPETIGSDLDCNWPMCVHSLPTALPRSSRPPFQRCSAFLLDHLTGAAYNNFFFLNPNPTGFQKGLQNEENWTICVESFRHFGLVQSKVLAEEVV